MRKLLLGGLAAATLIARGVVAQPPAPPPPSGMDPAQAAAGRADDMALLLGLHPDQRPALDDFLGKLAPPASDRHGPPDGSWMQQRMDAMQSYRATLTPDQQARFDAIERLRHGMGGGRMGGGRGHWGGGGQE
ncbi:hypothetical protein HZF05_11460 [Sphingomonas sp. CGMCC 1.13654]|uniref:LTXXQ motif family protein n=1 Tax=Sphingomonas chungangi TaxID=2683589 RepID=A0A838L5E9_9SPHN|nr:hypothetical protein [Sphingomonas chungangi]MBA2934713.1 hypothetical protein [Sphingomonas chungangi]MVW58024.1 hypothetical protein [Sphingomonas chungangi]